MDFIQVIIFIVIIAVAIVQQIRKASKAEKVTSPREVLADMFPPIEEEEILVTPAPAARKPQSPRRQNQPTSNAPKQAGPTQRPVKKKPESPAIKLSSKEEARRAFIYSEIFNRKY